MLKLFIQKRLPHAGCTRHRACGSESPQVRAMSMGLQVLSSPAAARKEVCDMEGGELCFSYSSPF